MIFFVKFYYTHKKNAIWNFYLILLLPQEKSCCYNRNLSCCCNIKILSLQEDFIPLLSQDVSCCSAYFFSVFFIYERLLVRIYEVPLILFLNYDVSIGKLVEEQNIVYRQYMAIVAIKKVQRGQIENRRKLSQINNLNEQLRMKLLQWNIWSSRHTLQLFVEVSRPALLQLHDQPCRS